MGKIITTKVDRFDHGMNKDIRTKDAAAARLIKNFDALSFPHRLVPHKSSESGQDTIARKIFDFVYVNSRLYGLGTLGGLATLFYKDDYGNSAWSQTANNQSDIGEDKFVGGFLIYYAKTSQIYGCMGSSSIFAYTPGGGSAWVDSTSLSLSAPRAIVHSKDDMMYVGSANKVSKNNNGIWTSNVLTLPSRYSITALSEYGNYLAIAVRSNDEFQSSSRVFLWDRDSSVSTLAESIDWGLGNLRFLEELNGQLVGVSYLDDGIFGSLPTGQERLILRSYNGATPQQFLELVTDPPGAAATGLYGGKMQKINDRLYFLATIVLDSTTLSGIWSVGRMSPSDPYAIQLEFLPNNDTAVTSLEGFYIAGTFAFIAYNNNGSISKSDDATHGYTATSVYESPKYNVGEASMVKKLVGASVTFAPLPASGASWSAGTVVLKYKVDSDTSWTTAGTQSTANELSLALINNAAGATLPDFKEVQFRIESTNQAEITSYSFDAEVLTKGRPY